MDKIRTRRIWGVGVGVIVGVNVSVGVGSGVSVSVIGADWVMIGGGVRVSRSEGLVLWQAGRRIRTTSRIDFLNCVISEILPVKAK
jgi:hypothetical protein